MNFQSIRRLDATGYGIRMSGSSSISAAGFWNKGMARECTHRTRKPTPVPKPPIPTRYAAPATFVTKTESTAETPPK